MYVLDLSGRRKYKYFGNFYYYGFCLVFFVGKR